MNVSMQIERKKNLLILIAQPKSGLDYGDYFFVFVENCEWTKIILVFFDVSLVCLFFYKKNCFNFNKSTKIIRFRWNCELAKFSHEKWFICLQRSKKSVAVQITWMQNKYKD